MPKEQGHDGIRRLDLNTGRRSAQAGRSDPFLERASRIDRLRFHYNNEQYGWPVDCPALGCRVWLVEPKPDGILVLTDRGLYVVCNQKLTVKIRDGKPSHPQKK